jgi:hypothetical protein
MEIFLNIENKIQDFYREMALLNTFNRLLNTLITRAFEFTFGIADTGFDTKITLDIARTL